MPWTTVQKNRGNHHLDERDEAVAEGLHGGAQLGEPPSEAHAQRDGELDLDIEDPI
jgi:hypothetical protein